MIEGADMEEVTSASGQSFDAWLRAQKRRDDWIDDLAAAARGDPRFPRQGSPEQVRTDLENSHAEGDMLEALDQAEREWASS